MPNFTVDRAADVTLSLGIFGKKYFAGAENSFIATAEGDFDCAIEVHDVLPSWGVMEIVIVIGTSLSEDDSGRWD